MSDRLPKTDPSSQDASRGSEAQFLDYSPLNWRLIIRTHAWRPPTDVYETEGAIIVRVEIAGMNDNDFAVELNGHILSIHGVRQDAPEHRAYHQMEIHFGEFSIELELPVPIEPNLVEAVYSNGFLRVTLPKARPHQVQITE